MEAIAVDDMTVLMKGQQSIKADDIPQMMGRDQERGQTRSFRRWNAASGMPSIDTNPRNTLEPCATQGGGVGGGGASSISLPPLPPPGFPEMKENSRNLVRF